MRVLPLFYGPVSAAADYTSPAIAIGDNGNIGIGVTLSGADVVGTIQVFVAVDEAFTRPYPVAAAVNVTASGDTYLSYQDLSFPWARIFWDYTSGTGNISIDVSIRQQILNRG